MNESTIQQSVDQGLSYEIVVPTIGRASLVTLLDSLALARGPAPRRILLVDDRRDRSEPLAIGKAIAQLDVSLEIVPGSARGPAAARNIGWRATRSPWVVFLDDDVIVDDAWKTMLIDDLRSCKARTAASQGRITVPLPTDRRATDWERNVQGLEDARWITADCAYRRSVLVALDGFDERFPRAFREDADLALRVLASGWILERGERRTTHPVRPADRAISRRLQAGNADDALMTALHGADWYDRAGAERGCFDEHLRTVGVAVVAVLCSAVWLARTVQFASRRLRDSPKTRDEITAMVTTSATIPFAAVAHRIVGAARALRAKPKPRRVAAVLFDRDGTIVHDAPIGADPTRVLAMPGALAALRRLRAAGLAIGIVTNQSDVGEGRVSEDDLARVHARIEEELGTFATWQICAHAKDAGCGCRKPAPGLVIDAAHRLGVDPAACVVVGDIGSDIEAAYAAGARAVLVPTPITLPAEIAAAPVVARTLAEATDLILSGRI